MAGNTGEGRRPLLDRMSAQLAHRGPDDNGTWWSADQRVGLAHRRLAIIDLSPGGHQPMLDSEQRAAIVFNGEIYNFVELRAELEKLGHRFHTVSDTEVILEAYKEWGTSFLTRLNGMFALALYDLAANRLLLARDRAGEKPLFYRPGNGIRFASELKALLADPELPRRIDAHALNSYLAYGYVSGEECILKGFRKLPQGGALIYDVQSDTARTFRYWSLPEGPASAHPDESQQVDELEWLLRDSVRHQLIADVPVGILLSGGLDSSLVTAVAASVASGSVKTFTVGFPGHGMHDEAPHARRIAQYFGTEHVEIEASPATVDLLPELIRQYDEPIADSSMVPTFLVSRLVRQHAKVALGGDGGDELFGGYPHYNWIVRQERIRRMLPGPLRSLLAAGAARISPGVRGRNHLMGLAGESSNSVAHVNLYFDRRLRRKLVPYLGAHRNGAEPERLRASQASAALTPFAQAAVVDFTNYLVDDILVKVDRASMLTSLEVRAPLLDYRIIEFAFRMPDALRANAKERKILLRRLAKRLLPPGFDLQRKQGFSIPLNAWFRGPWGQYMESVLLGADSELFSRDVVRDLVRQQRRGLAHTHRLFALTAFELWRREYRVSS